MEEAVIPPAFELPAADALRQRQQCKAGKDWQRVQSWMKEAIMMDGLGETHAWLRFWRVLGEATPWDTEARRS